MQCESFFLVAAFPEELSFIYFGCWSSFLTIVNLNSNFPDSSLTFTSKLRNYVPCEIDNNVRTTPTWSFARMLVFKARLPHLRFWSSIFSWKSQDFHLRPCKWTHQEISSQYCIDQSRQCKLQRVFPINQKKTKEYFPNFDVFGTNRKSGIDGGQQQ